MMKKAGYFLRSILPFLAVLGLQIAAIAILYLVNLIRAIARYGPDIRTLTGQILSLSSDTSFLQASNLLYGILALAFFGLWYLKVFVLPFRNRVRSYPTGFSFHTAAALVFLAVGLQYVCALVVNVTSSLHPAWLTSYQELMESSGYENISLILALYAAAIAPAAEELIFRGLIFRYARHALPFWGANLWQALLFGVMHLNVIQGVYAFVIGMLLGWTAHRGRGIKYSIVLHILFNVLGAFCSEFFSFTTGISYPLFCGLGILLTIFGLWLFHTDFQTEPDRNAPKRQAAGDESE